MTATPRRCRRTTAAAALAVTLAAGCAPGDQAGEDQDPLVDPDDRKAPDAVDPTPPPAPGDEPDFEDAFPEFEGPDPEPDAGEQDPGP